MMRLARPWDELKQFHDTLEHFHLGCSVGLAGPLAARDVAGRERPG